MNLSPTSLESKLTALSSETHSARRFHHERNNLPCWCALNLNEDAVRRPIFIWSVCKWFSSANPLRRRRILSEHCHAEEAEVWCGSAQRLFTVYEPLLNPENASSNIDYAAEATNFHSKTLSHKQLKIFGGYTLSTSQLELYLQKLQRAKFANNQNCGKKLLITTKRKLRTHHCFFKQSQLKVAFAWFSQVRVHHNMWRYDSSWNVLEIVTVLISNLSPRK